MFNIEIVSFLSPYNGKFELLPSIFFTIILSLFIISLISLTINAKPENWDKNWQEKNLDIEQGSITELSDSIATKSEKVATAMPGIVLIIGLLGTFIGLGLALDKASIILSSADMNNVDSSMGQLMGMMEGLGTKFKTSTWGLIAFLLLKALSSKNNFEEKRLSWVSNKIRTILDNRNQETKIKNEENLNTLLISIENLTTNLIDTQKTNMESRSTLLNNVKRESLDSIIDKLVVVSELNQSQIQTLNEGFNNIQQEKLRLHKEMLDTIEKSLTKMLQKQDSINSQNAKLLSELNTAQIDLFHQQHNELTDITNGMSNALATTFMQAMTDLQTQQSIHSETNQENLKELAQRICESIETQQSRIIKAVDKNSHYLDVTAKESQQTRQAMDKFVNESLTTIEHLKQSAAGISQAAKDMGGSASQLQNVIDSLSKEMNSLLATMKQDLGATIDNMDKSFVANMNKMTTDLNHTIEDMNNNFKQNMETMSGNLGIATNDISKAVKELSSAVDKTMNDVSDTIKESMDLQRESQNVFTETSELLEESIIEMTQLVEKLSNDITEGLDAISDINRQAVSLNKRYNNSSDKVEELIKVVENTQSASQELKTLVYEIKSKLDNKPKFIENINNIERYCNEVKKLLENSLSIQTSLLNHSQNNVKNIPSITSTLDRG